MASISLLLALDGTSQSRHAAELCWHLARTKSAKVTAQYVVDSVGLWEFLNHQGPGFIGSGPYLKAHEAMRRELLELGQTLIYVYETFAASNGAEVETILDEGSTVREIYQRAQDYDLVVMGYRASGLASPAEERRRFPRYSVAQKLAHSLNRPLLLVQEPCEGWTSVTVLIGSQHPCAGALSGCLQLASFLSVPLRICYCIQNEGEHARTPSIADALTGAARANPELQISEATVLAPIQWYMPSIELEPETLVVIPTVEVNRLRETSFGIAPDPLAQHATLSSVLLWPNEYAQIRAEEQPAVKTPEIKIPSRAERAKKRRHAGTGSKD